MLTTLSHGRVPPHSPGMKPSNLLVSSLALALALSVAACGGVEPGQADDFETSTAEARTVSVADQAAEPSENTTTSAAPTAQTAPTAQLGADRKLYPGPRGYEMSKVACNRDPLCSYGIWTCGISPSTGQSANCCCTYH